jgi:hypothetical protein
MSRTSQADIIDGTTLSRKRSQSSGVREKVVIEPIVLARALDAIQGALTHTKETTTLRYLRRGRTKKIGQVAEARSRKRAEQDEMRTACQNHSQNVRITSRKFNHLAGAVERTRTTTGCPASTSS